MLIREDLRHLNTDSDSEVLLNVFAHELQLRANGRRYAGGHLRCGAGRAPALPRRLRGGRDDRRLRRRRVPRSARHPAAGARASARPPRAPEYMVASESVALDMLRFARCARRAPRRGSLHRERAARCTRSQCAERRVHTPCIFEYVYFARPDSIIDNISVYKARLRMGEQLADKIVREWPDHDIDVVIPIPDTSRTAALQLAYQLGVKYREGFIKNRYIGRTFIMPGQAERKKSVRQKLNAIDLEFEGKNVLLVDDSIVRGTTSQQIIQMAREAGARKVYFASAAPPVRYPNVYGIDMPAARELIANGRTIEEIQEIIGADRLIYQDLHDLIRSVRHDNSAITEFDTSCFSGEYVTGDVTDDYLHELETRRNDAAKQKRETRRKQESNVVSLLGAAAACGSRDC